jgi:hypothetical protein
MRAMAAKKKSDNPLRGTALIKKAIEAAKTSGAISTPEPVPAAALKKLRLPNDEKISPALKELLAFDATWLGWEIDEEEPELEPLSLDELIEQEFGEDQVGQFGEAIEMLPEDCLLLGEGGDAKRFLYVGTPDDKGEYPVITVASDDGCWVSGFVPFDVWVAQQLGVIAAETERGGVPAEYEVLCKALAEANGDGRVSFKSESRELERSEGDDEDADDEDDDGEDDDQSKDNESKDE